MSGQSDTESCEDEPMTTVEDQVVQSITNQDNLSYTTKSMVISSKSPIKSYKIINGKLVRNEQKSFKPMQIGSKYVMKSEPVSKKQTFVLKDGECTRTCSTVFYYSSKSDPAAIDSSLGEESKENDNPEDPEDQISVEDMDLSNVKMEPNSDQSDFDAQDYSSMCNIEYNNPEEVEYFIQNNGEYDSQEDLILENVNNDCLIETELVFDTDYVEEVGANIELSTEEMAPVYTETISCDICDEVFEDRKELMRHIQTMHIGQII